MAELIRENTTAPARCEATRPYYRFNEPFRERRCRCDLFMSHDGPHKGFISGIGWHAWEPPSPTNGDE